MNWLILCLFFVSGTCALIYQVVWTRMMTHVFGSTSFAVSTVLAAFMTGMALGSYFLGKRADQRGHPLKRYAVYEVGIGLTALLVPLVLDRLAPLYVWMDQTFGYSFILFSVARFVVAFLLILLPTTLMGATLPILSRFVITRFEHVGRSLGSLYAINTFGAVCGSLLAGFYLIGSLGTHNAIYIAAILNLAIGALSWHLAQKPYAQKAAPSAGQASNERADDTQAPSAEHNRLKHLVLWGFAISGLASFAYEVFWTRALIFYLGNSTYAFTIMLTTFLVGIAVGGYLVQFFVDRLKDPMRFFAGCQIAIGVTAALAMPVLKTIMQAGAFQQWLDPTSPGWSTVMLARFVVAGVVMLPSTVLIGMTFPLAGKIVVRNLKQTSGEVGKVYAVNTVGNIAGALLPAFVLLPWLGIHKGIVLTAVINLAIGLIILAYGRAGGPWLRHLSPAAVAALLALVFILPMNSQFPSDSQEPGDEVLYYKEGLAATTKVYRKRLTRDKHISVDGIQIGGSGLDLDYKQQWLAHLPKLLLDDYNSELSVGLGSGILIGESATHAALDRIVCVEIAPSVVEGASFFAKENHGVLQSPKAEIVVDDGVNYLLTSSEKYDIISTDGKTKPEYGVNGTFFSKDYYTLMKEHLTPGGLAIQWIPTHYPPDVFRTVLKTFVGVFPEALLWYADGNCFLVGANDEIALDLQAIKKKLSDPKQPYDGLRKFGIDTPEALLSHLVAAEDVLSKYTAEAQKNTLAKPVVEFYDFGDYATPAAQRQVRNLEFILSMRGQGAVGQRIEAMPKKVTKAYEAEAAYLAGRKLVLASGDKDRLEQHFDRALEIAPNNDDVRHHIFGHYLQSARDLMRVEKIREAEPFARRAVELWPNSAEARHRYGYILLQQEQIDEAIEQFEAAVAIEPELIPLHHQLASYYARNGQRDQAIDHLRAVLAAEPDDWKALNNLGNFLADRGKYEEALRLLKRAYKVAPENPNVIDSYAWITYQSGNQEAAREIVQESGQYAEGSAGMTKRRATILR
jgi:spermidine synthase